MTAVDVIERRASADTSERTGLWVAAFGETAPGELRGARTRSVTIGSTSGTRSLSLLAEVGPPSPSSASLGSTSAIVDGTLYNRAELVSELGAGSARALSHAELVLRAYQRWGEDAFLKVKGIFAVVLWDRERDTLLCVRDRMGIYPLFYADTGRELFVSTMVDALMRHPRVPRALDRDTIADRLCNRWFEPEGTYFAAVKRLPPGHAMRVRGGSTTVFRYWNPAPSPRDIDWVRDPDDALDMFDAGLGRAVERCVDFGPTGIFLSGGFDSVSIAALAGQKSAERGLPTPQALSLIFPDEANEEDRQRGVSSALGFPHLFVDWKEVLGNAGHIESNLAMTRTLPVPLLNFWLPGYTRLAQEGAQRGCKAILNGTGGDEWLGVSPYLAADMLRRFDLVGVLRLWNNKRRSYTNPQFAILRSLIWKFGLRPLLYGHATQVLRHVAPSVLRNRKRKFILRTTPSWLTPDPALRVALDRRSEQMIPDHDLGPFYQREMQTALGHRLVSMEAEENFELGRRTGVHICAPYWDADLIDLLYRVHPDVLNRGGRSKGLVRDSVERRHPNLGFKKHKKIISVQYFSSTVRAEWPRAWQQLGGVRALADMGIIEPVKFKAYADDVIARQAIEGCFTMYDVLNMESWAREH